MHLFDFITINSLGGIGLGSCREGKEDLFYNEGNKV